MHDSLRFASGVKFQSCIHRVVPFGPSEHRDSIVYFLRAEDDTMFRDNQGRWVTRQWWHDQTFDSALTVSSPIRLLPGAMYIAHRPGVGCNGSWFSDAVLICSYAADEAARSPPPPAAGCRACVWANHADPRAGRSSPSFSLAGRGRLVVPSPPFPSQPQPPATSIDGATKREVAGDGCVLVRPDRLGAWRCEGLMATGPEVKLQAVMRSVLGLGPVSGQ
ncbi:hypothetical protein VTH06DRAFT_7500 [Thermothelomyces fergusii]